MSLDNDISRNSKKIEHTDTAIHFNSISSYCEIRIIEKYSSIMTTRISVYWNRHSITNNPVSFSWNTKNSGGTRSDPGRGFADIDSRIYRGFAYRSSIVSSWLAIFSRNIHAIRNIGIIVKCHLSGKSTSSGNNELISYRRNCHTHATSFSNSRSIDRKRKDNESSEERKERGFFHKNES